MTARSPLAHSPVPTRIYWDPALTAYNFGDQHPMNPERLRLTAELAEQFEIFDLENVSLGEPEIASDAELEHVHTAEYIEAVRAVSEDPTLSIPERGLGTADDPAFAGMHDASARIVGGSLLAARDVASGRITHAVNFSGGLHHAMPGAASGFCVYNDAALAIQELLDLGVGRVIYIDVDAHHGDGVEKVFWDEPRVMTISLHESGMTLFPGTGFANDIGGANAEGTAVNVALGARTGDGDWLRAFHSVVPQLAAAFEPEVIVSQHGCDSHRSDPLTNLRLSVDAQRQAVLSVDSLARKHTESRWLALGGGGYNITSVVPRTWTHLMALASGRAIPLETAVPAPWREMVKERYGVEAPERMGDGADLWWKSWDIGYDPNSAIDRAIMATRKEVFPLHGLDPWFD
ncbi:acetoin utilization protein AcuC [Haematomicrobium sanguinis]|uniref:acetoin utilization protein AcuC n=1 Tax=Haematomicrobium sanguinis TaxID=479106 RepID=UPI00068F9514